METDLHSINWQQDILQYLKSFSVFINLNESIRFEKIDPITYERETVVSLPYVSYIKENRQDFLKKQLSLTVGMPDIFGSFTYKYITSDPVYRSEINFHPEYPVFNIGLSYKINNFKAKPSQQNNGGGMNVGGI